MAPDSCRRHQHCRRLRLPTLKFVRSQYEFVSRTIPSWINPAQPTPTPVASRAPWWLRWLGALIEPWIRIRHEPRDPRTQYDPALPVCYVTERYGLSDTLILEQACREAGLPEPLHPFAFRRTEQKTRDVRAVATRWLDVPATAFAHPFGNPGAIARRRARSSRPGSAVDPRVDPGRTCAGSTKRLVSRLVFGKLGCRRPFPASAVSAAERTRHHRAVFHADFPARGAHRRTRCAEHPAQGIARTARPLPSRPRSSHRPGSYRIDVP